MTQPRQRDRSRAFDVTLFGATGFTGRLVAEYLVGRYPAAALRLALAGRNREKLERVRAELGRAELPILIADSADQASLDAVAAQSEVVCTTVGPFARYGAGVVQACAEHGTDYCDVTGEPHFVKRMIDEHHERARASGARVVCCAGFDSIPSDLGVWMLQQAMLERYGVPAQKIKFFLGESRGGPSGGTLATLLDLAAELRSNAGLRRTLADPYSLDPAESPRGPSGRDSFRVAHDADLSQWTAPFVMAGINTRIVRRSHALLGHRWGRDFEYEEVMSTGSGPPGLARAAGISVGLAAAFSAALLPGARGLLERFLPAPGEGPSRELRESGFFRVRLLAKAESVTTPLWGQVEGHQDPGYGATARMLGESAACLALDTEQLDSPGGVLTPASCMAAPLLDRLRGAGMTWRVDDTPPE